MKRFLFLVLAMVFVASPVWSACDGDLSTDPSDDCFILYDNTDGAPVEVIIGSGLTYTHATYTLTGLTDLDDLPGDTTDDDKIDQAIIAGMGGSATPGITLNDTDAAATGTAFIATDAVTAGQDSILQIKVDDSAGEDTVYVEVDGVAEDVEIKKVLAAEGGIKALTPVIDDPDNFAANFTVANLYGGTFICNADGTAVLPDAGIGMNFTIVLEAAAAVVIDPLDTGTADTIYMNGLAAASDENITSSTLGAMCVFQYRAANTWMATCNGFAEATPP